MLWLNSLFSTIRGRVLYGTLLLSLLPVLITALILSISSYQSSKNALEERATDQLESVRNTQARAIERYMSGLSGQLQLLSASPLIIQTMQNLKDSFELAKDQSNYQAATAKDSLLKYYEGDFTRQFGDKNNGQKPNAASILSQLPDAALALQNLYIANNANPLGSKNLLLKSNDNSAYSAIHAQVQPFMAKVFDTVGMYDVFLVDPKTGNVVYTYYKELDFATNLVNGPYAKTKLAEAFIAARDNAKADYVYLSDFAPYLPSYNDQAAFMSAPIISNGSLVGVLVIQVPINKINDTMMFERKWQDAGLGESGESYLVGGDKTPRSESRFYETDKDGYLAALKTSALDIEKINAISAKGAIGLQPIKTLGVDGALAGNTSVGTYEDYRDVEVLGAYQPINILNQKWALLAEVDSAEAFASVNKQLYVIAIVTLVLLALVLSLGTYFARRLAGSINTPLNVLSNTVEKLAQGDFSARVKLNTTDELGVFAKQFDDLLDDRVATLAKAEAENEQLNNSVVEIMTALFGLSQKDLTIKVPVSEDVTGAVSDGLNLMTSETAKVLRLVEDVSMQVAQSSVNVRTTSEQARAMSQENSHEIALASAELASAASALNSITLQAQSADKVANEAILATREALEGVRATVSGISSSRDLIRETEKRIKRLGERTQEISTAVNAISSIADRTGILALNTSMQAVAAGEAGRAYAVVADEVKRLAESARAATQQIANLVSAIQSETVDTVDAINRAIGQVVDISKIAERAGEQMQTTDQKTSALVESVRDIARTTTQQAQVSDVLQNRAVQLQKTSEASTKQMEEQSIETAKLVDYAQNLVQSVSVFKLS